MIPSLFITGTDTGAGKTVVTAALVAALPDHAVRKPVLSGAPPAQPPPVPPADLAGLPDDLLLWEASGRNEPLSALCFHRYLAATAPSVAANLGEDTLDFGAVCSALQAESTPLLVEGVGGWRVWLSERHAVPDLARALGFPVLVVAGNRLGAINHSVLTCEAVLDEGLPLAGLVLNHGAYPDRSDEVAARASNAAELSKRLPCPVLEFPRLPGLTRETLAQAGSALVSALGRTV